MAELVKLGALWLRKDKQGKTYLSGKMGDAQLMIFENQFKETEKQPDYMVYVTQPRARDEDTRPVRRNSPLERRTSGQNPPMDRAPWDDGAPPPSDNDMPRPFNSDPEIPF